MKSRGVALLLCIFLGELGVHLFYLGRVGWGVVYLLTGGLFGIGWIYDIFNLAFMSGETFNRKFNSSYYGY